MKTIFDTIKKETAISLLGVFVVVMCFAYLTAITFIKVPDTANVSEIKMAVISILTLVVGYFFGSSRSSHQKDDTIKELSQTQTKVENINTETTNVS